jgi:hypothetical protein
MNTDVNVKVTAKLMPMQRYILYQCAKYDKGLTIEEIYGVSTYEIPFNADKHLENLVSQGFLRTSHEKWFITYEGLRIIGAAHECPWP